MRCPFCNQDNTRVVDSRPIEDNNAIRRRRMCDVCGRRFTTYEKVETIPLIVIKKDQNREQYDRRKIETGILRACHSVLHPPRNRLPPWSTRWRRKSLTAKNGKYRAPRNRRTGHELSEDSNQVAYVRFASIYREFKDVNTFLDELKKMLN